ncbi:hypothetical protein MNEG_10185 [Monoraphidium neglectum]|uniref:Uncharacterized protein n=1 Tax=Monoraphidium neglectum TaxID=145388 RepID=A0A0D2JDY9_9CHLO|nr:hypothetical protein MNEG_10185 [Monoraphidium neglectum]KIY97777.1 hypothetical protein MNEG_10185 [Monoraphidium neglectum]|eukprot:XP_013896797.1 hypothetical protein MNEG_10185 [Monoraphidium neglectum]
MTHGAQAPGEQSQLAPLVAGVIAGAANVASGYAFDTVKVRLQTGRYSGMVHCFKHIVQTEGVSGSPRVTRLHSAASAGCTKA